MPVQVVSREQYDPTVEGGYELNMPFVVQRFRAKVELPALPGMGMEALAVRRGEGAAPEGADILRGTALENGHLRAEINANGTVRLTDKATGRVLDNLCWFEDTAEFGDPWSRVTPEGDAPFTSARGHGEGRAALRRAAGGRHQGVPPIPGSRGHDRRQEGADGGEGVPSCHHDAGAEEGLVRCLR